MGFFSNNSIDQYGNDANDNRNRAIQTGDNLNNYLNNQANYYGNIQDSYRGQADTAYNDLAANPGYSDAETKAINGNPNAAFNYYQPDQLSGDASANAADLGSHVSGYAGGLNDAASNLKSGVSGAAHNLQGGLNDAAAKASQALQAPSEGELSGLNGVYGYLRNQNEGGLSTLNKGLDSAVDPSKLTVSDQFAKSYAMSPEEEQNIKNVAGNTVQGQYQKLSDELDQRAAAEGNTSPAAIAAMKQNLMRQGSIDAGNAMSSAELNANAAKAQRAQTLEGMQLGANQDLSTRQTQNAATTYGAQTSGANNLTNLEQAGIKDISANKQSAASQSANMGYGAAQTGGQAAIDAEALGGQYGYSAANSGGQAGIDASKTSGAQRLATDAGNQQTGQGLAANADNASSNRATGVANQRITGQNNYRGYLTGQQGQAQQGAQTASGQAIQNAGTTNAGANQATQTGAQIAGVKDSKPTGFSQVLGAATGIASMFADGGIAYKPTDAIIGERGPEMVVKLGQRRYR